MDKVTFDLLVWIWTATAVIIFMVLLFITAPFRPALEKDMGPDHSRQAGMDNDRDPAPVIFLILVVTGDAPKSVTVWIVTGFTSYITSTGQSFTLYVSGPRER